MTSKANRATQWLTDALPQWWLGLMLLTLHLSLAAGPVAWWMRGFLIVHYGFFLMWQPFWRAEKPLGLSGMSLVLLTGLGLVATWGNAWVMVLWLAMLTGLVGGNVSAVQSKKQRLVYLLALGYLLSALLLAVLPRISGAAWGGPLIDLLVHYGLFALPVAILLIRGDRRQPEQPYAMDFFYGLMLFLLILVLVLGSFAVMVVAKEDYASALIKTLIAIALVLLALSWLWNPRAGFAGWGQLLSRYLLSVGLPFERWLQSLAELAERETEGHVFLELALADLAELPWLTGGKWETTDGAGEFGAPSPHTVEFSYYGFKLLLYTRWSLSPAMLLHVKLLTELLRYFYEAKLREQALEQNVYTQAIYETGARLTHDVKNLLQSLKTLCSVAETSEAGQSDALQALMKRQLPQIVQRLQLTLEKLQAPKAQAEGHIMAAQIWWKSIRQRYAHDEIKFAGGEPGSAVNLPGDLFDSVVDNLLQNALEKRRVESGLEIRVSLDCVEGICLRICDNGSAVEPGMAQRLLVTPVKSESGLGIGLYQAARQASQLGYRFWLEENRDGQVCFALEAKR
jgi:signal transduction histidine kinase